MPGSETDKRWRIWRYCSLQWGTPEHDWKRIPLGVTRTTKARQQCSGEWQKQNFVKIPEQKWVETHRTGQRELAEGFVTIGWEWLGSCKTGMMDVTFEMNQWLQLRPQTVVSRGLWWRDCRQFYVMVTDLMMQRIIKCASNSQKLVPLWQTRLFFYLSHIIIRMLTNLWVSVSHEYPKAGTLSLSLLSHAEFTASEVISEKKT